jgi:hypothetical protein
MVYNTQNYWVSGICLLFGILKYERTQPFGSWICFRPQGRWETPKMLVPLERVNLNYWTFGHMDNCHINT